MATYHTVDGQPYSVTAGTAVTVTDSDGLVLSVKAGEQGVFVGNGGDATVTGSHHIVQVKGGFAVGGGGGGGGGGEGGDVYKARDNDFTGTNKFASLTEFNGAVTIGSAASFVSAPELQAGVFIPTPAGGADPREELLLSNYNGDLYWGNTKLNGGGGSFDGHLNADLVIGSGVTGTKAEWTVHLGSLTSQGCLEESTTGYGCCVGVKPDRDARELIEDINTESSLGLIVEAVYVSETEIKLVARRAGDYANDYNISANDAGEPGVESPCFGRGPVPRTVDGRTDAPATSYSATLNGERMLSAADVDAVPMLYSMNPVSSDGVRRKLAGKASLADDNVFTGTNDFQCGLYMTRCTAMEPGKLSRNSCGDLYWGTSKLNDQSGGDVYAAGCNVFTGTNSFRQGIYITDSSSMEPGKLSRNSCGDLYWDCTKLNGGGDVYSDGCNVFTGYNTFDSGANFSGCSSFHGDTSFNGSTYFNSGTCFHGDTQFNGGTRFNGSDTYFYETPYLLCGLYLDGSYGFKLGLYNGHLYFRDARLDSALHNPATSGGTVEITIGQKSLVLDCSKLQRLIDLLEQQ